MNSGRTLIKALTILTMLVILVAGLYPKGFNVFESINQNAQSGLQGTRYALADTEKFLPQADLARLNKNGFVVNLEIQPPEPEQFAKHFMVIASISNGDAGSQFLIGQWRETIIVMNGNDFPNKAGIPRLQVNTKNLATENSGSNASTETQAIELQFSFSPNASPATAEVFFRGERVVNYTDVYALLPQTDQNNQDEPDSQNTESEAYITFTNVRNREHGWSGQLLAFELLEKTGSDGEVGNRSVVGYDFTSDPVVVNGNLQDSGVNLLANYQIREPRFLKESTGYFSNGKRSLFDIVLNFAGFVPLGLLLLLLIRKYNGRTMSVFLVTIAGLATSLMLEIIQGVLPSRDSTVFDVFFNTSGAFYGGLLGLLLMWLVSREKSVVTVDAATITDELA